VGFQNGHFLSLSHGVKERGNLILLGTLIQMQASETLEQEVVIHVNEYGWVYPCEFG
jgi:hypothetical protein